MKLLRFLFTWFWLLTCSCTEAELFAIPPTPQLNAAGEKLIFDFEGCDLRPDWPGGASGPTLGWGYDAGYYSRSVILSDWRHMTPADLSRWADSSGLTGRKAQGRAREIRDILIARSLATEVFEHVDVPREYDRCKRAFPGFEFLRKNAQSALISLGYNRGYSMIGDGRREMRAIRDLSAAKNYESMAAQIRAMKRLWVGTSIEHGMSRRRDSEASLMAMP